MREKYKTCATCMYRATPMSENPCRGCYQCDWYVPAEKPEDLDVIRELLRLPGAELPLIVREIERLKRIASYVERGVLPCLNQTLNRRDVNG